MTEKPMAASVIAMRKQGDKARDTFYGPSLPVAWVAAPADNMDTEEEEEESSVMTRGIHIKVNE